MNSTSVCQHRLNAKTFHFKIKAFFRCLTNYSLVLAFLQGPHYSGKHIHHWDLTYFALKCSVLAPPAREGQLVLPAVVCACTYRDMTLYTKVLIMHIHLVCTSSMQTCQLSHIARDTPTLEGDVMLLCQISHAGVEWRTNSSPCIIQSVLFTSAL